MIAGRRHPDLLAERARMLQHADAKAWDRVLAPLVNLRGGLVLAVAGLDELLGWSPDFSMRVKTVALVFIVLGYALGSWALIENRYFSSVVRIQIDRGHLVVSSGPYAWIRHPGYAGALLVYWCTPAFIDFSWAFLPAVLLVVALVIRTQLEDEALQRELAGYAEYARRVRYRLLPGVW